MAFLSGPGTHVTQSTSRHPWDPLHPKARNRPGREFEDLMTFSGFSLDSLEERETYTETPADHFDPPPTRQSLRFWKLVPTVSTLAFIAGYLLWVFGGSASSQSVMMWAPLAAPLLYLGASAPARHLSQKKTLRRSSTKRKGKKISMRRNTTMSLTTRIHGMMNTEALQALVTIWTMTLETEDQLEARPTENLDYWLD